MVHSTGSFRALQSTLQCSLHSAGPNGALGTHSPGSFGSGHSGGALTLKLGARPRSDKDYHMTTPTALAAASTFGWSTLLTPISRRLRSAANSVATQ